ncbi:MAG: hypothetical protein PQJ59_16100 [Spirochaetales bacterium]|nr:hypothetical protein [Spirochaetales bacterium]
MKHKRDYRIIWFPALLNKIVAYTLTMTIFLVMFYFFTGTQQFSDRTVNGIIEMVIIFSVCSFFFAFSAIIGRIIRNRYVSNLKKKSLIKLIIAMVCMVFITLIFSAFIVIQSGYGYNT